MSEVLYSLVIMIADIHSYVLKLNDAYELYFNDKELHFIVIGLLGIVMVILIYPIFKFLAKRKHYLTLTWIYVFTLIIVITFAIEIGQKITHTGGMEFADIVFGIAGFLAMFAVYACIITIFRLTGKLINFIINSKKEKAKLSSKTIVFNGSENKSNGEEK